MMVTTGARGSSVLVDVLLADEARLDVGFGDALRRVAELGTISSAVSASITSVILCIAPCFIRNLMRSTARSVMRLESSWIVIASGMITSRTILSRGCWMPIALSFSRSRLRFERGERALALLLVERVVDRELAALALLVD